MEEKEVEALFVKALEKLCGEEGLPTRLPFNVSKISDVMKRLSDQAFVVQNSPFGQFRVLAQRMADAGHVVIGRGKSDNLNVTATKYAPAKMREPLTHEAAVALARKREEARAARVAARAAEAAATAGNGHGNGTNGAANGEAPAPAKVKEEAANGDGDDDAAAAKADDAMNGGGGGEGYPNIDDKAATNGDN